MGGPSVYTPYNLSQFGFGCKKHTSHFVMAIHMLVVAYVL
jgi:hypothetical protein